MKTRQVLLFDYNVLHRLDVALSRMDKDYSCSDGINHHEALKQKRDAFIKGRVGLCDSTDILKQAISFCGSLIPNINKTSDGRKIPPKRKYKRL